MLWNVVVVSAMWQCESAICIPRSPPSPASHPHTNSHPTPLGHHRAPSQTACLHSSCPLAFYFTQGRVYMSVLLSQFVPPSFCPCVHSFILYICVYIPGHHVFMPVDVKIPRKTYHKDTGWW